MLNALLAMLLMSPVMGILGTMAVNNKMAFFSDALGHSALTGIALGVALGVDNKMLSASPCSPRTAGSASIRSTSSAIFCR